MSESTAARHACELPEPEIHGAVEHCACGRIWETIQDVTDELVWSEFVPADRDEQAIRTNVEVLFVEPGSGAVLSLMLGAEPGIVIQPKLDAPENELALNVVFGGLGGDLAVLAWILDSAARVVTEMAQQQAALDASRESLAMGAALKEQGS